MSTPISLNNCQKICLQLQVPTGVSPYTWSAINTNVTVATGGSGFSAIVTGIAVGASQVVAKDANNAVIAGFSFVITDSTAYTPVSTSNTVELAFFTSSAAGNSSTQGTFSGISGTTIGGLSTTGNGNNTCWFVFIANPGNTLGIGTVYWNRGANANAVVFSHGTNFGGIAVGLVGLGVTSNNPSIDTLDYKIPIVQFISSTQASSFATTVNLPFTLACASVNQYIIFAMNSQATPQFNAIKVSNLPTTGAFVVGWNFAVTTYNISYMVVARGIRNVNATSGILYSDISSFLISNAGNSIDITLDTAVTATPVVWFAQFRINSIIGGSSFQFTLLSAYQTTTTNLQVRYSSGFAGSQTVSVQYICFYRNPQTANLQFVDT